MGGASRHHKAPLFVLCAVLGVATAAGTARADDKHDDAAKDQDGKKVAANSTKAAETSAGASDDPFGGVPDGDGDPFGGGTFGQETFQPGDSFIDDTALDKSVAGITWHGYFQSLTGLGVRQEFEDDFVIAYDRLELQFETRIGKLEMVGKPSLEYSVLDDDLELGFRELYASRFWKNFDLHVGEKIVTWGITDFYPVVDMINPRDFSRMQNWRPIDEKLSAPILQAGLVVGPLTFEAIAIPVLRYSEFQFDSEQPFSLPNAFPSALRVTLDEREEDTDNAGGGGKVDLQVSDWKISAYGAVVRNPIPSVYISIPANTQDPKMVFQFERVLMVASSIQGAIDSIGTILKAEAAYYERIGDDCEGIKSECFYLRQTPTAKATVGLLREIAPGLDAHLQLIGELLPDSDRDDAPEPLIATFVPYFPYQPTFNPIITLRLEGKWFKDNFRPMVFAYTSFAYQAMFVDADLQYFVSDGLSLAGGVFWFQSYAPTDERREFDYEGAATKGDFTLIGNQEDSSYVYARVTAWF